MRLTFPLFLGMLTPHSPLRVYNKNGLGRWLLWERWESGRLKVKELRARFGFGGAHRERERSVSYGCGASHHPHPPSDWPVNIGLIIHRCASVTCVESVGQMCIHYTILHYAVLLFLYAPAESLNESRVSSYLACIE